MNRTFAIYFKSKGKALRETKTVFIPKGQKHEPVVVGAFKQYCISNDIPLESIIDILEVN